MKIIIPGDPVAQTRMRHANMHGITRVYDPRSKEKNAIKRIIASQNVAGKLFLHPRICFVFHMAIPKHVPKKLLALHESGALKHEKKPDVDNLIKLYLDCMDGIVFQGDQCVSLGAPVKLYHPYPKTFITVTETKDVLEPWEVDYSIWSCLRAPESGTQTCAEMALRPWVLLLLQVPYLD